MNENMNNQNNNQDNNQNENLNNQIQPPKKKWTTGKIVALVVSAFLVLIILPTALILVATYRMFIATPKPDVVFADEIYNEPFGNNDDYFDYFDDWDDWDDFYDSYNDEKESLDTSIIEYVNEPFTVTESYFDGEIYSYTEIESIEITSIYQRRDNEYEIYFEVIGKVIGDDSMYVEVQCYDDDGFLIKATRLSAKVADGARFKVSDYICVPDDTVRIEFTQDQVESMGNNL